MRLGQFDIDGMRDGDLRKGNDSYNENDTFYYETRGLRKVFITRTINPIPF